MPVNPVPPQHHTVTPYLVVDDAVGLMKFMVTAFGGTAFERIRRPDGKIGHAEVKIGDSFVMLGSTMAGMPPLNAMVHLYVPDVDATFAAAVAAGAAVLMPVSDQFYGDRSGGVTDPFGIMWWISTHIEDPPPEELQRRALEKMKS